MLPEFILREERRQNYSLLALAGFVSAVIGVFGAQLLFPDNADLISVFIATLPIVYPLTGAFLEDERAEPDSSFWLYTEETAMYMALFAGEVAGFYAAALVDPGLFSVQLGVFEPQLSAMGVTGFATSGASFGSVLSNNLLVYATILVAAGLIGSAGAFVLTWNGSVLGVFLAVLTRQLSGLEVLTGSGQVPSPLFYIPHATLEMGGFIVAGICGTVASAAIYRRHFDRRRLATMAGLAAAGVALIVLAAAVETA